MAWWRLMYSSRHPGLSFILNPKRVITACDLEVDHKSRKNENGQAHDENRPGGFTHSFPLFEEDAPDIAEDHVERHEDAPGEDHDDTFLREEAFSHREAEELGVPEDSGETTEEEVICKNLPFDGMVIAEGFVFEILEEAVGGIGKETPEGDHECGGQ